MKTLLLGALALPLFVSGCQQPHKSEAPMPSSAIADASEISLPVSGMT